MTDNPQPTSAPHQGNSSHDSPDRTRNCLIMTRGPHPGAKVALDNARTILGENGKPVVSLNRSDYGYLVKGEDATVLVTLNGDPLPPVAKPVQNRDILRFSEIELICCMTAKVKGKAG